MIKAYFLRDEDAQQVVVSGHAGYADPGNDIICAACSILNDTLANMSEDAYMVQMNKGFAHIYFTGRETARRKAILDTIQTGYQLLADSYPEYVCIYEYEEGP